MTRPQPFKIDVPDAVLQSIRARVQAYRWDALADAGGWSCGTDVSFMRRLTEYWTDRYDWRKAEQELNRYPQFTTTVDGLTLHFYHVKGKGPAPQPLVLTHGWPGSVFEFLELIGPLTDPVSHGGDARDAFDVVIPSLPGFGFSGRPPSPIGPRAIARAFDELMTGVLGYPSYIAQGGDWGCAVSAWLGYEHAACKAIHLNMLLIGAIADPQVQTPEEQAWLQRFGGSLQTEGAYAALLATKPQTQAYLMLDNPVGVAAWIVEKFAAWVDAPRAAGGVDLLAKLTLDQLLTNIMLYVATDTFGTAGWIYHACHFIEHSVRFPPGTRCEKPTAVARFNDPVFEMPPRSLAERNYNIVRWTEMPRGGHFAALEEPELLVEDVRAFARGFR